jgi:hypothetical protein
MDDKSFMIGSSYIRQNGVYYRMPYITTHRFVYSQNHSYHFFTNVIVLRYICLCKTKTIMTLIRKHSFIRRVKDISISGTLALAILGNSVLLQSCGSSDSNDDEDYQEVEVYTKGVKTFISETSKGQFKITDEIEVPADSSVAIVTYLDGKKETLSPRAVQALIDNDIKSNPSFVGQNNNLSNALLFGGMGYLLAKTMSPNYANYRPDLNPKMSSSKDTTYRRRHHSGGFFYYPMMSRYYSTQSAFQRANTVHESIGSSRTTTYRPSGGRSGFFRSTGRSGFRG